MDKENNHPVIIAINKMIANYESDANACYASTVERNKATFAMSVLQDLKENEIFASLAKPEVISELTAAVVALETIIKKVINNRKETDDWFDLVEIEALAKSALKSITAKKPINPAVEALQAIERICRESVKENDGPHRVWIDGKPHEGPVADFVIKIFRGFRKIAEEAIKNAGNLKEN